MSTSPTAASRTRAWPGLDGYAPLEGVYDEVFVSPGELRLHWRQFFTALQAMQPAELTRRWEQAQEQVREDGVMYTAYEDADDAAARPWELDAWPLVIGADQWEELVRGLQQRAGLLNRILRDLYGPQRLLTEGLLPADWLFSHPGFQRPWHGQQPRDGRFLHFYAADLARAPDGQWWVVADRTDAPLGAGYALENRIIMSRMLPHVVRDCHVQRLAPFFISLRETLRNLAPAHRENPRTVLLSHGPSGPNYFEDAYLARYLGYTLVEGGDLAVRDDRVFMKTLAGLLPVDVILRRMSDALADPLEIPSDTSLGVPGLLQAVRLGHVAVANALGSSLVESPSLMPFLPHIAQQWLGQELQLPSLATWWCGEQEPCAFALQHLDRLAIRSAYRVGRQEPVPAEMLWSKPAADLSRIIAARPRDFVAQEHIERSSSPVWRHGSLRACRLALRVFLAAAGDSYEVMPGGLVRVASQNTPLDLSIIAGDASKDAWVLSTGPVREVSLLQTAGRVPIQRTGADLPSRVADNLFWLGRQIERAAGACRLLRPVLLRMAGEADVESMPEFAPLIHMLASQGQIEPGFAVEGIKDLLPSIEQALPAAVLEEAQAGSLRATFSAAYRNASLVRDRLSLDGWRILHRIERELQRTARQQQIGLNDLLELLHTLVIDLAAFDGLVGESMTRTPAWRFLDLGRRIERAVYTCGLVQSALAVATSPGGAELEALLEVADSIMTYRGRYLARTQLAPVLDLLITDETNPRAIAFQLAALVDHVEHLPRDDTQPLRGPEQRLALTMLNSIRMIDADDLHERRAGSGLVKLDRLLSRLCDQLPKLADLVSHKYLIHAGTPRQMTETTR